MSMRADMLNEQLVATDEMATLAGVSPSTIRRLVKENGIPFVRVRGSLRFNPQRVIDYLSVEPKPPVRRRKAHTRG